jgi:hypothetical protein
MFIALPPGYSPRSRNANTTYILKDLLLSSSGSKRSNKYVGLSAFHMLQKFLSYVHFSGKIFNSVVNFFNWYSGGVESNWVHSALRPPIGLLCQSRVIIMMEELVE